MSRPTPRSLIGGLLLAALAAFATPARAEVQPKVRAVAGGPPASAIFIGNSFFYYNNGIHNQVRRLILSAEAGAKFRATMATISGSGIDWHDVDSYFRPNAIGRYSFNEANAVVFNKINRLFDAAIIMDCSQCPIHPDLSPVFWEFAARNIATIRKHGAQPVMFMSWAYADKPEMTAQLADAYTRVANQHDAIVIPAGLAFARAIAKHPTLKLYDVDKRHPSPAGTYLAAATTYAVLTGKSPVGLKYTASLDAATASILQEAAWETVRSYHAP